MRCDGDAMRCILNEPFLQFNQLLLTSFLSVPRPLYCVRAAPLPGPPAAKPGGGVPPGRAAVPARVLHGHRGVEGPPHRPADAPADRAHPVAVRHQLSTYQPGRDDVALLTN